MSEKPREDDPAANAADALRALSSGEDVGASDGTGLSPLDADIPQINFDVDPDDVPATPVENRAVPPRAAQPEQPAQPSRAPAPPFPPAKPSAAPPPVRTAEPATAPAAPKRVRPASPVRPLTPLPASPDAGTEVSSPFARLEVGDDDDSVIFPEAPLDPFGTRAPATTAARAPIVRGMQRSLAFRRTVIPILLTCGLMFPTLGAMWFASDPDSVVRNTGVWMPVTFVVLGAILLLLAVVNMAQVRHMVERSQKPGARSQ